MSTIGISTHLTNNKVTTMAFEMNKYMWMENDPFYSPTYGTIIELEDRIDGDVVFDSMTNEIIDGDLSDDEIDTLYDEWYTYMADNVEGFLENVKHFDVPYF